jgi:apolipoprotein N-acyltransferase
VVQGHARQRVGLSLALLAAGLCQAGSLAWPWRMGPTGEPLAWLQCLSLALLLPVLRAAPTPGAAFMRGWLFAWAWLTGTFWWLHVSMHTYGGLSSVLAAAAVAALAGALALYYGVAAMGFWRWRAAPAGAQALAFAALWTLAELARGTWFTGFPWGAGGYAQVDALGALAPWIGVYGMGAVSAAVATWASAWLRGAAVVRGPARLAGAAALLAWAGLLSWPGAGGWLAARLPLHTESTGRMPVVLLQGNIPQDEKFLPGSGVPLALEWYGGQILAELAGSHARGGLVAAPETAIPLLPQDLDPGYWQGLQRAVAGGDSALLLGLPLGDALEGYTNSVAGWVPGSSAGYRYDKHHLVPFGEFIPPLFRWFTELMNIPLGDFNRGALVQPPLAWGGQRVAPNICYEDLFGEELAATLQGPSEAPTVLLNLSNIAWFGDTVAIDQHRHISRLRALELQRPMLRATNTGATAVIDHQGRVVQELPRLTRAVLRGEVEGRSGLTPYARWAGRWGLWPLGLACVLAALLAWAWARRAP